MTVRRTSSYISIVYVAMSVWLPLTLEELLLKLCLGDLDLDRLVDLLLVSALVIGIVLDGGRKEGVDEGGLSEARFTGNLLRGCRVSNGMRAEVRVSRERHQIGK